MTRETCLHWLRPSALHPGLCVALDAVDVECAGCLHRIERDEPEEPQGELAVRLLDYPDAAEGVAPV